MDDLQYIKEKVDMLVDAIMGDPTDQSNPGMIIRIDRLEHSSKITKNTLWLIGSITLVILGNLVIKYV